MHRCHALALLLVVTWALPARAAVLPVERGTDWSIAGLPAAPPTPLQEIDAADHGATGDGTTSDDAALQAAIDALGSKPGVVHLGPGSYRLTSGLRLKSGAVLRGASAATTRLRCDLPSSGGTCLAAYGTTTGAWRAVTAGLERGSTALTVDDATGLAAGDWIELRQANGTWDTEPADWAKNVVGQIERLVSVDGGTLVLEHPLRIAFDPALSPQIVEVVPVLDAGVEDLGIERTADPTPTAAGNNLAFSYAARCWVRGIESARSIGAHVGVYTSSQLEITGSYFHDAFTYDGTSTRGYGVTLNSHTGACLVQDNVFRHLRHAMMVKTGANGNVFAFNYSREPNRSETYSDFPGDISVHGHWPYLNLFEGNVVQNVITDQTWGPAGRWNTFLRNRVELYGLLITPESPSPDQNYVGNDVLAGKTNSILALVYGLPYALKGTGHFAYGNDVKTTGVQPAGTGDLSDVSYYRGAEADFCRLAPDWPCIGLPNPLGAGSNRARQRWDAGGPLPVRDLVVTVGPGATVAEGGSATLTAFVQGGYAPVTHAWTPAEGLSDPLALDPVAAPGASTTYTFTATDGYGCPASASVRVRVTGTVATPTLAPASGTYTSAVELELAVTTPLAVIRYTLDGQEPTEDSAEYVAPVRLDADVTVRARAFREDWVPSDEVQATYAFDDVDECALGLDGCADVAACTNTWLGYSCACPAGFDGDGFACQPVCGDHAVVGDEGCDLGPTGNGAPGACCDADCRLIAAGVPCRPSRSTCDPEEACTGTDAACPSDTWLPEGRGCDDADACTTDDACASGLCAGLPLAATACDDTNPCTDDACDSAAGCEHVANAAPCDPGDPCVIAACLGGACTALAHVDGCCTTAAECALPFERCDAVAHACGPVLCEPCAGDGDCGAPGNRCVPFLSGPACAVDCSADPDACPEGYACDATDDGGPLCRPAAGDCTCVPGATVRCEDGDLVAVSSCDEPGAVVEACGARGCVDGACCPEGTTATDDGCEGPASPDDAAEVQADDVEEAGADGAEPAVEGVGDVEGPFEPGAEALEGPEAEGALPEAPEVDGDAGDVLETGPTPDAATEAMGRDDDAPSSPETSATDARQDDVPDDAGSGHGQGSGCAAADRTPDGVAPVWLVLLVALALRRTRQPIPRTRCSS